ncbi:MAG: glycosyltransferase family 4 protein [Candidatus Omnitrophica bacterium]|nr:glycosyltransferase family 4 protein [Candidatus Omnitrophota bacterium]
MIENKVVVSHPTGNQNVINLLLALRKSNRLRRFFTAFNWQPNCFLNKILPNKLLNFFQRRLLPGDLGDFTTTSGFREIGRILSRKMKLDCLIENERSFFSIDKVALSLDSFTARSLESLLPLDSVYCYEYGAFNTFKRASRLNVKCVYELSLGYWKTIQEILYQEKEANPLWADSLILTSNSRQKGEHKDFELLSADLVIVPSSFAFSTLKAVSGFRALVRIVNYGAPTLNKPRPLIKTTAKLKTLFLGRLTQRKGLSYLFEAFSGLSKIAELTLIGEKPIRRCLILEKTLSNYTWLGNLSYRLIRQKLLEFDVLVLPSLCEGLSLVILEAMASGLVVIATVNSGAGDVVSDGIDGFLIPIRSADAIAEKIELLSSNRDLLSAMSAAAYKKAQKLSWHNYQRRVMQALLF